MKGKRQKFESISHCSRVRRTDYGTGVAFLISGMYVYVYAIVTGWCMYVQNDYSAQLLIMLD